MSKLCGFSYILINTALILIISFASEAQQLKLKVFNYSAQSISEFNTDQPTNTASALNILVLKGVDIDKDYTFSPDSRSKKRMRQGEALCISDQIKTKARAEEFLFSLPVSLYLSHRLYQLTETEEIPSFLKNSAGELTSLVALFEYFDKATIFIGQGHSYGKYLDKSLSKVKAKNIYLRGGGVDFRNSKHKMFLNNRVDFIFEFPSEFFDYFPVEVPIRSYALAKNSNYVLGHFLCSKSAAGEKLIAILNKSIMALYKQDIFLQSHLRWLRAEEKVDVQKYLTEAFSSEH